MPDRGPATRRAVPCPGNRFEAIGSGPQSQLCYSVPIVGILLGTSLYYDQMR